MGLTCFAITYVKLGARSIGGSPALSLGCYFSPETMLSKPSTFCFGVIWILAGGRWRKALKEGGPGGGQGIFGSDENGVILDR